MNRPFFATKAAPNPALFARVGMAFVVLVGGLWAFGPSTASTLRWTVGKVGVRIKRLITPGPGNFPVCSIAEVPAVDVGLLEVPEFGEGDWPGWRGLAADNCAATADCPTVWSEQENVMWRASLPGKGHATPLVVGTRIFVTTAEENSGRVLAMALDKESGQEIWRRTIAEGTFRSIHEFNSHASSTPVCDGQNLYVAALTENSIHLSALSVESGEVLWTKHCGPCTAKWGFSGSLAFWRGLVYVVVDNPEGGWIAAFSARQGKVAWLNRRAPAQEGSYSSPIVARIHDVPQIVIAGAETITAFEPESGAILWNYQGIPSCCASTVVVADDLCFASGGWPNRQLTCIRVNRAADAETWTAELLWEADKASEAPYVPTPLCHDGKLYVVHDQGVVMCRDDVSGKITWKRRLEGNFNASPILIGDRLLVSNDVGVSSLLDLESGKVVARNSLPAGLHASPVASGACLLLKTDEQLYCIGSPRIAKR